MFRNEEKEKSAYSETYSVKESTEIKDFAINSTIPMEMQIVGQIADSIYLSSYSIIAIGVIGALLFYFLRRANR